MNLTAAMRRFRQRVARKTAESESAELLYALLPGCGVFLDAGCGLAAYMLPKVDAAHILPSGVTIDDFSNTLRITGIAGDFEVLKGAMRVLRTQRPYVLTTAKPSNLLFELTQSISYNVFAYTTARDFIQPTRPRDDIKLLLLAPSEKRDEVVEFGTQSSERAVCSRPGYD